MRGLRSSQRRRDGSVAVAVGLAVLAGVLSGPVAAQGSATHILVITGLGGEPSYAARMQEWATKIVDAAGERFGVPRENIQWLAEKKEIDPARVTDRSTKESIEAAIGGIAGRANAGDVVLIVLFGHGSYQSGESRLSLPGPDLTAQDFAVQLGRLSEQKVVFANTASASGEFIEVMSGPGRVIVTATRSGTERNATQFGEYFSDAFANDVADTDKDGGVSVLEAFTYARTETNRYYETEKKLPTEHAVLDDNGDKTGTSEANSEGGDGALAQATFIGQAAVVAGQAPPEGASPALLALYAQRKEIEDRLTALRARKDTMGAAEYEKQLEALLVELALKNQEIRRMEGGR
ncbi:MAG: C13 family peptidase [Longimicrobiales bacterium]